MRLLQETERRRRDRALGVGGASGAAAASEAAASTASLDQVVATVRRDSSSAAKASKATLELFGTDEASTPPALWAKLQDLDGRLDTIENPPPTE